MNGLPGIYKDAEGSGPHSSHGRTTEGRFLPRVGAHASTLPGKNGSNFQKRVNVLLKPQDILNPKDTKGLLGWSQSPFLPTYQN